MIKRKGNLFDSDIKYLGHGTNCKGLMGAGIALEFKKRFPKNYDYYVQYCRGAVKPGDVLFFDENAKTVVNMFTQDQPGANAKGRAIFSAGMNVAQRLLYSSHVDDKVVAIPMIGAGIGGMEWYDVECVLRTVEILNPGFEWEVWKYEAH